MTTQVVFEPLRHQFPIESLHGVLSGPHADSSLVELDELRERLDILDALDAGFGAVDSETVSETVGEYATGRVHLRAQAIRSRLEAMNANLYRSIRSQIIRGSRLHPLLRWIQAAASNEEDGSPVPDPDPGPAYDWRDELLSGVLQLREPSKASAHLEREMVFYQPTPVRHILRLIELTALSEGDVLVDLGSGLGHVPLLASILTGAQSIGIEVEAAYVASAQECAQALCQSRVRFIHEDARTADLSAGTVFYLYSPFTGSITGYCTAQVAKQGTNRPIKICAFGPCTCALAKQRLANSRRSQPNPDRITVFHSKF